MPQHLSSDFITPLLQTQLDEFQRYGEPIAVDFRSLLPGLSPERHTHLIHPYPAKLLVHIPYFFLNNSLLVRPGATVLDPFAGSGTVLLEAALASCNPLGAEVNPVGRLVTRAKLQRHDVRELRSAKSLIQASLPPTPQTDLPRLINPTHWYSRRILRELHCLSEAIHSVDLPAHVKDFFLVAFSVCTRRLSNADPRLSVPVLLTAEKYKSNKTQHNNAKNRLQWLKTASAWAEFSAVIERNIQRASTLPEVDTLRPPVLFEDARTLSVPSVQGSTGLADASVDLVLTSPPYAGAQKYVRSQSLNMGWLGYLDDRPLTDYKRSTIGREQYRLQEYTSQTTTNIDGADALLSEVHNENPLRAHIAATYILEMQTALTEAVRVLKPGGHIVLIAANNQVCGRPLPTTNYLSAILTNLGLTEKLCLIDTIHSRGLMTKRNKTASMISREWVYLFRKGEPHAR